jgi:hypothetical protein
MKNSNFAGLILILALVLVVPTINARQRSPRPQAHGGGFHSWMAGGYQSGRECGGMMHGQGYGQSGYNQKYAPRQTPGKLFSEDKAKVLLQNYLDDTNNPDLKLAAITYKDSLYEAWILSKGRSLVDNMEVNKETRWFRSAY